MSKSIVEQADLEDGYTYFEVVNVLSGTGVDKHVVLRGGKHPKMRLLLADASAKIAANAAAVLDYSYLTPVIYATKTPVLAVIHRDGASAAINVSATAAGDVCPLIEDDPGEDVFEADEDVIVYASTAGGVCISVLILKFEVVN